MLDTTTGPGRVSLSKKPLSIFCRVQRRAQRLKTQTQMKWEKKQEHETRLDFNMLCGKATIVLLCLIKFINSIMSFINPDIY